MAILSSISPDATKALSRYLAAATLAAAAYLAYQFFFYSVDRDFQKMIRDGRHSATPVASIEEVSRNSSEEGTFENQITGKSLFQFSAASQAPAAPSATVQPGLLDDLTLVGILPGDNPQVILESRKTQKTYYLTPNQSTDDILVEEVKGQTVTVSSGGVKKTFSL